MVVLENDKAGDRVEQINADKGAFDQTRVFDNGNITAPSQHIQTLFQGAWRLLHCADMTNSTVAVAICTWVKPCMH